jgi:hypothetical protein
MMEYAYEYPDNLWAVSIDTVAITRVNCSPLDHGPDCPRYIRADIVTKLLSEACSIIRKGQAAASASYHQAYAEWQRHDITASKHGSVVQDFRDAAWRFLLVYEEKA